MELPTIRLAGLTLLALRATPVVVGAAILIVGLAVGALLVQALGIFVFGFGSTVSGLIEVMTMRKSSVLDGQNERLRLWSGWLSILFGILIMLTPIFVVIV